MQNTFSLVSEIIKESEGEESLKSKVSFANLLNCKYSFVLYSYQPEKVLVYNITDQNIVFSKQYDDILSFSLDLSMKRDQWMSSVYEESDLPLIDKFLRLYNFVGILTKKLKSQANKWDTKLISNLQNHYSFNNKNIIKSAGMMAWPGNLDGLLVDKKNIPIAIIEFATVNKTKVKDHCHNTYFSDSKTRKGDAKRWEVVDNMRVQTKLPLIIIVWSPNKNDDDIKIKLVDKIIFDNEDEKQGLYYTFKKVIKKEKFLSTIEEIISIFKNTNKIY